MTSSGPDSNQAFVEDASSCTKYPIKARTRGMTEDLTLFEKQQHELPINVEDTAIPHQSITEVLNRLPNWHQRPVMFP